MLLCRIQNVAPTIFNKNLLFNLVVTPTNNTSPNGYIFVNISGLSNPQYIGNSTSFIIQFLETQTNAGQCVGCVIAEVRTGIFAQSTTAGDILIFSFSSSNLNINEPNNITIYSQIFAPIPSGGQYQIILPPSITPVQPIYCENVYGFVLTNNSMSPACAYNHCH